ncbi:MAG: 3-hydroxyacyl-CoA dehydrogenase NAD-binding domain-containing protein [Gammaproteobacteria bacterium]
MTQHWRQDTDAAGVVWLYLDAVGAGANVLNAAVFDELDGILTAFSAASPSGIAFCSGKSGGFIAGADVKAFQTIRGRDDALAIVRRGQDIMNRIEALPCPTVAVIHGFCLGGGLELALACDYRVALDDPGTRLGLPEIKLGIHPGFGGTLRSIRLLGPVAALDMMLTGKTLNARRAQKIGLVDHAVPLRHLHGAAHQLLITRPARHRSGRLARLANLRPARAILGHQMRKRIAAKASPDHYPAPYALLDLWRNHGGDAGTMLDREAESVAALSTTDTARNLLRVFKLQNRLKSLGDKAAFSPRHVHVIGGGTMGGDIAAWIAARGLVVTVQDTGIERLAAMVKRAFELFSKQLDSSRQVASAMDRLVPDHKGLGLGRADVVIEAIFEDAAAKQALYREIEPQIRADALLATNTSSLHIDTLAQALDAPDRLIGLHFFNPVARMPLVEVVCGAQSHADTQTKASAFVRHIDKLPLPTASRPGFLVNRVLTPYLLEAVIMVDEGIPIAVIDQAAVGFGMPMGPIELADNVGLDVVLAAAEGMARQFNFEVPGRLRAMTAAGHLGRKSGRGFYMHKPHKTTRGVTYTGDRQALENRLILRLINETVACLREGVVEDADLVDAGIVFGTGFAPFRGGPLHYRDAYGREAMRHELRELERRYGERFAADPGWSRTVP